MPVRRLSTKPSIPRKPRHSLFFAAVPPDEIRDQMAEAWQSRGSGERFRRDTLHLSLQAVAELETLDPALIDRARRAATTIASGPFELCLDRLMTFSGRGPDYPLVIGTDDRDPRAKGLAVELHHALKSVGLATLQPKVTPHVTLAYGPGFPETRPLTQPVRWVVQDFTLIHSHLGQGRHEYLGTWPLVENKRQLGFEF